MTYEEQLLALGALYPQAPGYAPPVSPLTTGPQVEALRPPGSWRPGVEALGGTIDEARRYLGPHADQAIQNTGELVGMALPKFGTQEGAQAGRQIDAGQYGKAVGSLGFGAAGAMLDLIPGEAAVKGVLGAIKKGAQMVPNEAMAAIPLGIRAYHGSPHDFDRFDLSKIGTGEGAQAYGHGLYFAENEGVARNYRDTLSRKQNTTLDGSKYDPNDVLHNAATMLNKFNGDREAALKWLEGSASMKPTYDAIASGVPLPTHAQAPGRMYEVNINADPAHFLDWDKPLAQQSELVRSALPQQTSWGFTPKTGEEGYRALAAEVAGGTSGRDFVAATTRLREAGVPGIQYLDAGSRAAGDGSRNFVAFDDRMIDILRKYGLAGLAVLPPAFAAYQDQQGGNDALQ